MKKGEILCTVNQRADLIGISGIELALTILGSKKTETPVSLVTPDGPK